MAKKITVVISQGQSANPVKRKLEEDLVGGLLFERGVEVAVVPHLYDLQPDGPGMLCLQGITGDMVLLSWLFPRASRWLLDRNNVRGHEGRTLLIEEIEPNDDEDAEEEADASQHAAPAPPVGPIPNRKIYCIDLRFRNTASDFIAEIRRIQQESSVQTVDLMGWIQGSPQPDQLQRYLHPTNDHSATPASSPAPANGAAPAAIASQPDTNGVSDSNSPVEPLRVVEDGGRRWYPVIDYSRCTNCLECLDFCLFGVYGVGGVDNILVEQPDNCRKGCPACSRVCPANAIIFPQHKSPAIAGSADGAAGGLKIDLSRLFGAPDAIEQAALERDSELVAVGRDAVGLSVGIPLRQQQKSDQPKDALDSLMDQLDDLDL